MDRNELQTPRSYPEMHRICQAIIDDRKTYPDTEFYKRKGLVKHILEEYWPLMQLLDHLCTGAKGALTERSHEGPDAVILVGDQTLYAQITCANQSYKEALNREILSEREVVFPHQEKDREKTTRKIIAKGRALTTRVGKLKSQVDEIVEAVDKKARNYHEGTDILLIDTEIHMSDIDTGYSWRKDLSEKVANISDLPYEYIYVASIYGVYMVKKVA